MVLQEDISKYRIHPAVLQKYKDNNLLSEYLPKAAEENEKNFWIAVNDSKKPVKRIIEKLVRIKSEGKEYFYYQQTLKSNDIMDNPIHCNIVVGKYDDPQILHRYDPNTRRPIPAEIAGFDTIYELEWPSMWNEELESQLRDNIDLVLVTPSRKYSGFDLFDFKEKSFNELVTLGRFGTLNPVMINEINKRNAK